MRPPLVSILVPCRNAARWLERALDSALNQTWRELEVIVIDDGSSDQSPAIADRFASKRCRVIHQENRGASAARNHAFSLAQGEMIQYLDADDFLAPDKLERQLTPIEESKRLSWGSVVHLLDGTEDGRRKVEQARPAGWDGIDPGDFLIHLWGGYGRPGMVAIHQWLTPRQLIEKAGPWNENLTVDDDGEFFARVILAAPRLFPVPNSLCFYRRSRTGLSSAIFRDRLYRRSAMEAAQMKAGYLLAHSGDEPAQRAVSRLLTGEIVQAYPDHRPLVAEGMRFLQERGLPLSPEIEGPPWFRGVYPWIGWKAARHLQKQARAWRHGSVRVSST